MAIKRNYRKGTVEMSFEDWADILDHLHCADTMEQKEFAKALGDTIGEPVEFESPKQEGEQEIDQV